MVLPPAIFVPPASTVLTHEAVKTLANHTERALNHTRHATALVSDEVTQMKKVVLQNRMALDLLPPRGVTCAILYTKSCVSIPDNSRNVSKASTALEAEINHISAIASDPFTTW